MRSFCLLAALMLAGCASSGVKVSEEQARSFIVGRSTYPEVVAALGQPTAVTVSSAGNRIAVYSYADVRSRPQNFIPYVGPFVAGYDTRSSAVTFTFAPNGLLANMTSTQGGLGTGTNLAADPVQPPMQQPR